MSPATQLKLLALWPLNNDLSFCYGKEMAKVTSKLQLTVPKVIADEYGIKPGDQLDWVPAGDVIRVIPAKFRRRRAPLAQRGRTPGSHLTKRQSASDVAKPGQR